MPSAKHVAVLMGGWSAEREVSLRSGKACAGALELSRFGVASVSTGHTTELIAALAAVVIGGASLTGGVACE